VNAMVTRLWPVQPVANACGLALAFALSMAAGALLWRWVESPDAKWRRAAWPVEAATTLDAP
jgi:peptidoglycan/LPS O-acetylase OafA/YrhL